MKKLILMCILVLSTVMAIGCGNNKAASEAESKETKSVETKSDGNSIGVKYSGNLKEYYEMPDGTWECDGIIYKHRLVIKGKMTNADKGSTFVYLSNIEDITFDQAWKASGLSSNSNDYFDIEEAVLVELE